MPSSPSLRSSLLEALRLRQWAKNVFVLAGVVFAGRLFDAPSVLRALAGFSLFCAAASAVYLANDVADREADAHHPQKRTRPIASGRVSVPLALAASAMLAVASLAAAWALNPATLWLVAAYLASSAAYSVGLKRVFLVDAFMVAAGFVLRAAAGAAAVSASISPWLLVCTFLLALFLVLGKRRAEVLLLGDSAEAHREGLALYTPQLVDAWLTALSGATIVCYALYTQSSRTVEHFGTTDLVFTVPFVVYALFRYQALLLASGGGGDPGSELARDRGILLALIGWAASAAAIIYR
jgi:4-hydroxybenzoate polyprenyltransferase